jgi:hypothetical protein
MIMVQATIDEKTHRIDIRTVPHGVPSDLEARLAAQLEEVMKAISTRAIQVTNPFPNMRGR